MTCPLCQSERIAASRAFRSPFVDHAYTLDVELDRLGDGVTLVVRDGRSRDVGSDIECIAGHEAGPRAGVGSADSDRLRGYLVLRCPRRPTVHTGRVSVVDFEAADATTFARLLDAAVGNLGAPQLTVWGGSMNRDELDTLRALKFRAADTDPVSSLWPCILLKTLSCAKSSDAGGLFSNPGLLDAHAWDIRMLYSMRA